MTASIARRQHEVAKYTSRVLDLIENAEVTPEQAAWITRETVDAFRNHVNPGFLDYRKATDAREAGAVVSNRGGACMVRQPAVARQWAVIQHCLTVDRMEGVGRQSVFEVGED